MKNDSKKDAKGAELEVSRRGFLSTVTTGVVGAAILGEASRGEASPPADEPEAKEAVRCTLRVNGRTFRLLVEPRWTLLDVLREKLQLTGTKPGCERGECGACTVLFDGVPRYACLTLALEAEGHEITTIEGLRNGEELGPVQQAFVEEDALQCGFCTPGQVVAVEGLLRKNHDPSLDEIREGVSGNLCRCGAYAHIFRAAKRAADLKRGDSPHGREGKKREGGGIES